MYVIASKDRVGTTIGERYEITRLIGEGGMGAVFEALHKFTKRRVAVKILLPAFATNAEIAARFLREAQTATAVNHPNIVQVLDMGMDVSQTAYLVLEFFDGEDLGARLHKLHRLTPSEAIDFVLPVMNALVVAHAKGIIHRDLKPANIFLARQEDGKIVPKLLDFGISKVTGGDELARTNTGAVLGTPYYMAPEQARGDRGVDHRADIWAMGVVLYQCLSGQLPYVGENYNQMIVALLTGTPPRLGAIAPQVPAAFVRAIEQSMEKDRDKRFASMEQFAAALRSIQREINGQMPTSGADKAIGYDATVSIEQFRGGSGGQPKVQAAVATPPTDAPQLAAVPPTQTNWSNGAITGVPRSPGRSRFAIAAAIGLTGVIGAASFVAIRASQHSAAAGSASVAQVRPEPAATTTTSVPPSVPSIAISPVGTAVAPSGPPIAPNVPAAASNVERHAVIETPAPSLGARTRTSMTPPATPNAHEAPLPAVRTVTPPVQTPIAAGTSTAGRTPGQPGNAVSADAGQPPAVPTPAAAAPASIGNSPAPRASLRASATAALAGVEQQIRGCVRTGSVGVGVVFTPSGSVSDAWVLPPHAGTPAEACIVAAVRGTTIPAFEGGTYRIVHQYRSVAGAVSDPHNFIPAVENNQ